MPEGRFRLNCRVFYHDKCFDGACSASLFTRFHRECIGTASSFDYHGLVHRAGALYDESWFATEGENAIVDFKYSPSPRVSWWFDHHLSAFLLPEDEANFYRGQTNPDGTPGPQARRQFFDPNYTSCASWIAHIASTKFGMDISPLAELIHWADIVDGAKYESAQAAVEMAAPAMKLTMVIESAQESALVQRIIPLLTAMPLQQVLDQPFVQELLGPLMERHWAGLELIRERAQCEHGVITFDITDQPTEGYNKFIPYYVHPEGTYNVGLSKSSFRTKVSVGTNPWTPKPVHELVNLAAICERYGGGGHARVGAISFPVEKEEEARKAAAEIVAELRGRG
ncbi:phosphoesterase DHHA1 [Granulicella mallensis MP5ACTX8]|uniref:Phosphoesterase DHHA1 n=1 Tax=Granulicella mallensis (strain ATCC BAA-1857 / DSM 23137 / MP5ACTX8) TaxID=682795 RepID=G8P1C4_GRAMM|nr:phosphoesterase DHHA1 [Granulicella mallensis MP5ACTX8]